MVLDTLVQVIIAVILFATLVAAISSIHALKRQVHDEHSWRRREKALMFSRIYHQRLGDVRQRIDVDFAPIHKRSKPITQDELDAHKNGDNCARATLDNDISYFLAYLENIGLACRHNIADFHVLYDLMGNTYIKYHYLFSLIIKEAQQSNQRIWENIEWLADEFQKERKRRDDVRLPPTGFE